MGWVDLLCSILLACNLFDKMPSHKFACPEGVLHARINDVRQAVTVDSIHKLFRRSGDGYVICAYERVVDGMYGVEAYVEFRSQWRATRA